MRKRLLDLYCGAGGSAMGYYRAGFTDIVGVDNRPMPHYPFTFVQADALEYVAAHGHEFDVIHASPPCQRYSRCTAQHRLDHPDLLPLVLAALRGRFNCWVVENVPDAACHMHASVMLCGTMFGLPLHRHRLFETNAPGILMTSPCVHIGAPVLITGTTRRLPRRENSKAEKMAAIGIDWMTCAELDEAIPPAYCEWLGHQMIGAL